MEVVNRATLDHPKYDDDNGRIFDIFDILETVYDSSTIAATLKAYKRSRDGRAAWFAIKKQYMGPERIRRALKEKEAMVTKKVYKGDSNLTLESHVADHREANALNFLFKILLVSQFLLLMISSAVFTKNLI